MKTMKLGKTGIDISRMGLGTWSIGGGSAWGGDHDLQVVVDTIREAPKLGVNLIDTAQGFTFGNSEKILGNAGAGGGGGGAGGAGFLVIWRFMSTFSTM